MSKRERKPVPSNVYQHRVLGRTMCEWHPDGQLRIPTKRLDPADVHMLIGGIIQVLGKFAPETLTLLQHAVTAHIDMARKGLQRQELLPLDQEGA